MSPRHRSAVLGAFLVASIACSAAQADAVITTVDGGASAPAAAAAQPVELPFDAVSVFQTGQLGNDVRDRALAAAASVNAPATVGRGFTALMKSVRRGTAVVQRSTAIGWAFPMAVTALPLEAAAGVMGRDVSGVLARGQLVMGETSAGLRGARVGDLVDFVAPNGGTVTFVIGRIGTDQEVGGTEFVMSLPMADRLGARIPTRVIIYGQFDRAALTRALYNRGLCTAATGAVCVTNPALKAKVRRSWDPPDPDGQLSMAETKQLLGEFDIYYNGLTTSGWTALNSRWKAVYLPPAKEPYPLGISAMCNKGPLGAPNTVRSDLRAALNEVAAAGLASRIDVRNTNSYGGCAIGLARFARITQALGSISRHSWGQPIDMNTTANCQGCIPKMDCRVVNIFRKHGFAWGGNFLTPDGMHFEWVGERRDQLSYPSRFCRTTPTARSGAATTTARSAVPSPSTREELFSDVGFTDDHG